MEPPDRGGFGVHERRRGALTRPARRRTERPAARPALWRCGAVRLDFLQFLVVIVESVLLSARFWTRCSTAGRAR